MAKQLSRNLIEELIRLEAEQNNYQPSELVAEQLNEKTLLLIVAPTSMGKSTVIKRVTELNDQFAVVGSFTTRDPRPDEGGKVFNYVPHTDSGIEAVLEMINKKHVVQYMVHPTTKHIYGTGLMHYPREYNLLDMIFSGVEGIRKLPFKATPLISIMAEPSQWIYWFNQRFPEGHPERHRRRDEAIMCFRWLLGQPLNSVNWVVNTPDHLDQAAQDVIDIALGKPSDSLLGREYAEQGLHQALKLK